MPWTIQNPPAVAKNWKGSERAKCVQAANAVLWDEDWENASEEERRAIEARAIQACIHSAGRGEENAEILERLEVFTGPTTSQVHISGAMNQGDGGSEKATKADVNYRQADDSAQSCATCAHYLEGMCDGDDLEAFAEYDGAMVAFFLPAEAAAVMAQPEENFPPGSRVIPARDLHVTLAMFDKPPDREQAQEILEALRIFAGRNQPVRGEINGGGIFGTAVDGLLPAYAYLDAPDLPGFRQGLVGTLQMAGIDVWRRHGYVPHVTLAYVPPGYGMHWEAEGKIEMVFDTFTLAVGDERVEIPLGRE